MNELLLRRDSTNYMYRTYRDMLTRCNNKNRQDYKNYGGRGIKVCDRWTGKDGFTNFLADMGKKPKGTSLDRKDNNGDYTHENCRWATFSEQSVNQRLRATNSSGYKGVHWSKTKKKWEVSIRRNYNKKHLGYFENFDEAVTIRKEAELCAEWRDVNKSSKTVG